LESLTWEQFDILAIPVALGLLRRLVVRAFLVHRHYALTRRAIVGAMGAISTVRGAGLKQTFA